MKYCNILKYRNSLLQWLHKYCNVFSGGCRINVAINLTTCTNNHCKLLHNGFGQPLPIR